MLSLPGAFGGFGTYLGGPTGNPNNIDQSIEADSYYTAYSLGGAYKAVRLALVGGGVALCRCISEIQGKAQGSLNTIDVKIERTDEAFNYFLGLDLAPIKDLNIGLTYMSNYAASTSGGHQRHLPWPDRLESCRLADGTHEREDLPGYIGLGDFLLFLSRGTLRIEPNLTYYLENRPLSEINVPGIPILATAYDIGVALEYILNPQLRFSVGYMHTEIGEHGINKPAARSRLKLDAKHDRLGLVWSPIERLSLTLRVRGSGTISENGCELLPCAGRHSIRQDVWAVASAFSTVSSKFFKGRVVPAPLKNYFLWV